MLVTNPFQSIGRRNLPEVCGVSENLKVRLVVQPRTIHGCTEVDFASGPSGSVELRNCDRDARQER